LTATPIAARETDALAAPSPLPSPPGLAAEGALVRLLGASAETLHARVRAHLSGLAGAMGDDPFARKW
jgi:hypothetical protein